MALSYSFRFRNIYPSRRWLRRSIIVKTWTVSIRLTWDVCLSVYLVSYRLRLAYLGIIEALSYRDARKALRGFGTQQYCRQADGYLDDAEILSGDCRWPYAIAVLRTWRRCACLLILLSCFRCSWILERGYGEGSAVIVDVGTTRMPSSVTKSGFKLTGDVLFNEVAPKCSYITPVPGGVGPMTIILWCVTHC